jgi:hypothetical protein
MMKINPSLSTPLALGRTAEVYAWGSDHVLKLYLAWCPPDWVEREAYIARTLVTAGIPTPAVQEVLEVEGRRGIVYERVTGVSMLQDLNQRPWRLFKHARDLAALQAQFQRLTVPGLSAYRAGLAGCIRRAPLPEPERDGMLALLETLPEAQTLCHGDFHPGNLILSPRGPVVIDWMTACSGSPWADVARTSLLLTIGPKAAGKMVSPALRLLIGLFHQTYLNHYRTLVPDLRGEFQRWRPIVAAARLDEQIAPEREALLQMVKAGLGTAVR